MKRLDYFILFLTAIYFSSGCVEETFVEEQVRSGIKVCADLCETRTTYTSANGVTSVSWVAGDKIGLCTDKQENLCYIADESGKSTNFSARGTKLDAQEGDIVYAYYKYEQRNFPGNKSFRLPSTSFQSYPGEASVYDYLYAKGEVHNNEVKLRFKHVFAFLRVTLPTKLLVKDNASGSYKLRFISDEQLSCYNDTYNMEEGGFEGDGSNFSIMYSMAEDDISGKDNVTFTVAIRPQTNKTKIRIYAFANNYSVNDLLYSFNAPKDGFQAGHVYKLAINDELFKSEREKSVQALTALYNSTDGDKWHNNTNWLSDEPLYKWRGLNAEGTIKVDDIVEIMLSGNNMCGTLPEEFAYIMSKADVIWMDENGLYGVIPEKVRQHPKWQKFGWNILKQNPYLGGGFDLSEGTGLVIPEGEISFFVEDEVKPISEVFGANELTFVVNAGAVDMIESISDERVNYYLGYAGKGLGMLVTVGGYWDYPYDDYRDHIIAKRENGLPEDIMWAKDFIGDVTNQSIMGYGEMHLFDKNGNLLGNWSRDYCIEEKWYLDQMDPIVRKYLGEPDEHPGFTSEYYTSTDYSRDGEVVTLQSATVGSGIDLVFMGDGYTDKRMGDGGKYEQDMEASMECFFAIEPYKSFRNRFNVYAVKVVSPNEERAEGCEWRINFNNDVCFEYASEISGVDIDKVTIVNVTNNPNPMFVSGFTNMYDSGASVAHIEEGGPSNIIVHEAGGHGLGKLLDEYIYGGYEDNYCSPEDLESFKNWIKTDYHNKGWGVNVDTTNDPEKVIWKHFLADERYCSEVGIYQGAWYWPADLWRASENSVMNSDYSRFNAPSREAIYKWIMQWSEGDGWKYDFEDFAEYDKINRNSAATRGNCVERQDVREFRHQSPTIIKGSPTNQIGQDKSVERYLFK